MHTSTVAYCIWVENIPDDAVDSLQQGNSSVLIIYILILNVMKVMIKIEQKFKALSKLSSFLK
jgi:ABC-type phosphate transport system permease subunit